ncbi:MAG TPA: hypothetical protein VG455_16595, partial [Acidimicrobiales bacterium]|nr:hypothetical protein [Acidimicrobiales bacterium]
VQFCRSPRRAPALVRALGPPAETGTAAPVRLFNLREDLALLRTHLQDGGPTGVARRVVQRVRRQVRMPARRGDGAPR